MKQRKKRFTNEVGYLLQKAGKLKQKIQGIDASDHLLISNIEYNKAFNIIDSVIQQMLQNQKRMEEIQTKLFNEIIHS